MTARWAVLVGAMVGFGLAACGGDDTGPVIDSVSPTQGARGSQVELYGERFCGDADSDVGPGGTCSSPPPAFVNFGIDDPIIRANVVSWGSERITVIVPDSAPSGATLLVVTVAGVSSNAVDFTVQ